MSMVKITDLLSYLVTFGDIFYTSFTTCIAYYWGWGLEQLAIHPWNHGQHGIAYHATFFVDEIFINTALKIANISNAELYTFLDL